MMAGTGNQKARHIFTSASYHAVTWTKGSTKKLGKKTHKTLM